MKINLFGFLICVYRKPKRMYTKDELVTINMTRDQFRKKVTGGIRSACNDHPEIPKTCIGSISKRVVGTVMQVNGIPDFMIEEPL